MAANEITKHQKGQVGPDNGTPQICTRAQEKTVEELMNEVFNNDMLRKMIVSQVVQNEIAEGSFRDDLRSVRLVAKSWLQDASKYLLSTGQPLYKIKLTLTKLPSISSHARQNGVQLLGQFTSALTTASKLETKLPPFSLKIYPEFFLDANHNSFSKFLEKCASGLVKLEMRIPENGGSMTFLFPHVDFNFPHLQTLTLRFPKESLLLDEEEVPFSAGSNSVALPFIQSILDGGPKLNSIEILDNMESFVPLGIRYLKLPTTITRLEVHSFQVSSQLESLLHFNLPNLQSLLFCIFNGQYKEGLVSQILEKFSASLRQLTIDGPEVAPDSPVPPVLFRLPVMDKLEELQILSSFVGLEDGHPPLQNSVPELQQVEIYHTRAEIRKWTEFSILPNVTALSLHIFDDESGPMENINLSVSFPNLNGLDLEFETNVDFAFLKRIFLEMRQLQKLSLEIKDSLGAGNVNDWDSLFTGMPVEFVETLRANPGFLKHIEGLEEDNQRPFISLLTGLQEFSVSCPPTTSTGETPLISDIAFRFGFTLMKNCRKLSFGGRFKVFPEKINAWRGSGYEVLSV